MGITESAPDDGGCPQSLWIGRQGVANKVWVFDDEEAVITFLSNGGNKRAWNVVLVDPVEYFLVPPVPAKLTDKNPSLKGKPPRYDEH